MTIDLEIGGYAVRLREARGLPCRYWPLVPFEAFLGGSDRRPDIDLEIRVVDTLPEVSRGPLHFDASHGLWQLYQADSGYLLESPDTQTLAPRSRARVSGDFSHAVVWHREEREVAGSGWTPLHVITPIVEVCLVTKLARDGGLMLHASGVVTSQGGWVFTGPSGAGKSTLADLFAQAGASVLSDERVIIRQVNGEFRVYGTPWPGTGRQAVNASAPLTALYAIRHGHGAHTLRMLTPRESCLFLWQEGFLPHWDRPAMERTLGFLNELIERVGCRALAFVNTPDLVDYLAERPSALQTVMP